MNIDLDPDQERVATAPPSTRQVVIAGPGAGKTQVVSRLVENLVVDDGVDPVHGLVVLSFSNAAVHAVAARLRSRDVPPVQVRTIDSLATAIVAQFSDDDVTAMSFDVRIQRATSLLNDDEWDGINDIEHVVIDEVQDVVGVRADFVLALIDALPEDAGITILGDPGQAIYDFQLTSNKGRPLSVTTSTELLDKVRAMGAATVILRGQYRARSRDALAAVALRRQGEDAADPLDIEDFWNEVIHVGDCSEAWKILRHRPGSKVFLTATNGQALLIAAELRALGARVSVQRGAQQQVLASWIAEVFQAVSTSSISRSDFESTLAVVAPDVDPASAWRALRSVASARSRELDRVALASGLRARAYVPAELREGQTADVVVSTVHRAKGLEFDDVALVDFKSGRGLEQDDAARARSRFVALSRARDLLLRIDGPFDRNVWQYSRRPPASPRWVRSGKQSWQTFGFEVRSGDIDPDSAVGATNEVQALLRSGEALGKSARLEPDPNLSSLEIPIFNVTVDGTLIGQSSRDFGVDLVGRIGNLEKKRRGWPSLGGVPVESVATVVDESLKFRLVPILSGLAAIEWSTEK